MSKFVPQSEIHLATGLAKTSSEDLASMALKAVRAAAVELQDAWSLLGGPDIPGSISEDCRSLWNQSIDLQRSLDRYISGRSIGDIGRFSSRRTADLYDDEPVLNGWEREKARAKNVRTKNKREGFEPDDDYQEFSGAERERMRAKQARLEGEPTYPTTLRVSDFYYRGYKQALAGDDVQTGIEVELSDSNGNAFAILGACFRALNNSDLDSDEKARIKAAFEAEAMSGDYDHLLQTTMRYFEVS
jgi:hypothetical protein